MGKESIGWSTIKVKKLFIFVEGQTEERFAKELLLPYLAGKGIFLQPIISTTKVVKDGKNFRGGLGPYHKDPRRKQRGIKRA